MVFHALVLDHRSAQLISSSGVSNRLQEIEAEFDKHVSIKDITQHMDVDPEGIQYIYNYWKLKRKVGWIIQH